jgi:hypothetical protein
MCLDWSEWPALYFALLAGTRPKGGQKARKK